MIKQKNNNICREIAKFPYSASYMDSSQFDEFLSEKICCYTIKSRKKIIKKTKRVLLYGQLILSLGNGITPPIQSIVSLPIPIVPTSRLIAIHSNALSKKSIISKAILYTPTEICFTEQELEQLYNFSVEYQNKTLSKEDLIAKITSLKGGTLIDIVAALALATTMVILLANDWGFGFQPNPYQIGLPHQEWGYQNNNYKPGQFGFKQNGPRTLTVKGLTKNAGSDKKPTPSYNSSDYDYNGLMNELNGYGQSNKKKISIEVGDHTYHVKKLSGDGVYELADNLAELIYQDIRECDTDISDIASNLGYKADNIKRIKDHLFYSDHTLNMYDDAPVDRQRFYPDLQQALAWQRLVRGVYNPDDIHWIKHEFAESHHELKYASAYKEAHKRAQSFFDGSPWNPWDPEL
jgi:hypothetical protein